MNRSRLILVALAVIAIGAWAIYNLDSSSEDAQGAFQWQSFGDGLTSARENHKMIMVDVYTDWCGWCKKLDREVYPDSRVSTLLAKSFVAIKVNAESSSPLEYKGQRMTEEQFARASGVTGYPTILFMDEEGTVVTTLPGYLPADRFSRVLEYVADKRYTKESLDDYFARSL